MYNAVPSDMTRNVANQDSDAGIVGHDDLKGVTSQHETG
jgi:hypothetical protein